VPVNVELALPPLGVVMLLYGGELIASVLVGNKLYVELSVLPENVEFEVADPEYVELALPLPGLLSEHDGLKSRRPP
jgi:hypothetical protein